MDHIRSEEAQSTLLPGQPVEGLWKMITGLPDLCFSGDVHCYEMLLGCRAHLFQWVSSSNICLGFPREFQGDPELEPTTIAL